MVNLQRVATTQCSADIAACAYEFLEHIQAILNGMEAIVQQNGMTDQMKLMRIEKAIKAASYLSRDGGAFLDAEIERLISGLKGGEG